MASIVSELFNYGEKMSGIFEEIPDRYPIENADGSENISVYSERRAPGVSPSVYAAARKYYRMTEESWKGAGVGRTKTGTRVCEVLASGTSARPETVICIAIAEGSGAVYGGSADLVVDTCSRYNVKTSGGEPVILCLMDDILTDTEANEIFEKLCPGLAVDPETISKTDFEAATGMSIEKFGAYLAKLSDNIYCRIVHNPPRASLNISINASGELRAIKSASVKSGTYEPQPGYKGEFYYLLKKKSPGKKGSGGGKKPSELRELYSLGLDLTEEELATVPNMPDELYTVPERVEEICRLIKGSTGLPTPIRSFIEVGPAGTGKTTDVKLVAHILNLGYLKVTCHSGTELFDLVGQVVPAGGGEAISAEEILKKADLPTTDDVMFDLEGSYRRLTGKEMPKGFTEAEGIELLLKKTLEEQRKTIANSRDFVFVEGPLAKAMSGKYILELQEVMTIQQQGCLVGLNGIAEKEGSLELPSRTIYKDPYAIIAMTTNGTDYIGNLELQGSVESRNALYYEVPNPPLEVMAGNAMRQSGLKDKSLAMAMAKFVADVAEWRDAHGICCGSCGPRELVFWMTCVAVDGPESAYHYAKTCIVNKATHDPQERIEIISQILDGTILAV